MNRWIPRMSTSGRELQFGRNSYTMSFGSG